MAFVGVDSCSHSTTIRYSFYHFFLYQLQPILTKQLKRSEYVIYRTGEDPMWEKAVFGMQIVSVALVRTAQCVDESCGNEMMIALRLLYHKSEIFLDNIRA